MKRKAYILLQFLAINFVAAIDNCDLSALETIGAFCT